MKKTEKFVVIESNGEFVESYKNKESGGLAFEVNFTDEISQALSTPYRIIEEPEQCEMFKGLARAFNGRLLVVEAEYNITDLDGEDVVIEVQENKEAELKKMLLKELFGYGD